MTKTCARTACDCPIGDRFYRIWNSPHLYPPFKDYCVACGRKITEYSPELEFLRSVNISTFIIYWLDKTEETFTGFDIADACNKAGIGAGAIRAIDYYKEIM